MAPNVAFEQGQLASASTDIANAHADLAQLKAQMDGINQDLGGGWAGTARQTFVGVYAQFEDAYSKMNQALGQLSSDLSAARNVLQDSDNSNATLTNKVSSLINI